MRPHAEDFHDVFIVDHLVDQAVLNVDAAGIGPGEIADKLFERRRCLIGIVTQDIDERFGLGFKSGGR